MMVWIKARTSRTRTSIRTETGSEQGPENDGRMKDRTPRTRTISRTETESKQGPNNDGLDQDQASQDQDSHQNRDRIRKRT